jgi:hypothetical protein
MIRAKFRCLSITTKYDGTIVANLAPVKRDGKDSENSQFWKYSPNGDCELFFHKECNLEVGAYYYIDMERVLMKPDGQEHPDLWTLDCRNESHGGQYVNIEMAWYVKRTDYSKPPPVGMTSGRFKVGLSEAAEAAKEGFKPVGSLWTLAFVFVEKSDHHE